MCCMLLLSLFGVNVSVVLVTLWEVKVLQVQFCSLNNAPGDVHDDLMSYQVCFSPQ